VFWGEGNIKAPVFVLLDNPGARENKEGIPYLCGTRETLLETAEEAGVTREQLFVSYVLKCRPLRAYDKPFARQTCLGYLWGQLDEVKPNVVFTLGDVATRSFFEDPDVSVKDLRGSVHKIKGHNVVASYHPLAVRRRPNLRELLSEDWRLVATLI